MAYEGVQYHKAASLPFQVVMNDLVSESCFAVVVTGATKWGHCLLETPVGFFHITDAGFTHPRHIPHLEFSRYLSENDKYVKARFEILDLVNLANFNQKVLTSLRTGWMYGVCTNNCVTYVEDMLKAGGSGWNLGKSPFPTDSLNMGTISKWQSGDIIGRYSARSTIQKGLDLRDLSLAGDNSYQSAKLRNIFTRVPNPLENSGEDVKTFGFAGAAIVDDLL